MVLLCKGKFILIFTSINFSVLTKKSKPKDKLQVEELSPYLSVSILVYKPYYLFQYRINTFFFSFGSIYYRIQMFGASI